MAESETARRLRRGYAAFSRWDFDEMMNELHPDFEFLRGDASPYSDSIQGRDAYRAFVEPDAFESMTMEIEAIHETANGALIQSVATAKGAASGIEVRNRTCQLWEMAPDGRALRMTVYNDCAAGFAAAGIPQPPGDP